MRLLRLHDEAPGGARLELHPRMSVVRGLDGPTRERILAALAALPGGRGVEGLSGVSGTIESTGVLLDLEPSTLALLDLISDLDVVVRADDFEHLGSGPLGAGAPAVMPPPRTLDEARQAQREIGATHGALRRSLDALEEAHRRVLARRSVLASALADLGVEMSLRAAPAERAMVEHDHDRTAPRAGTVVLDSPGPTPEAVAALASAAARVDRLRTRRDETVAALAPFDDIDTTEVEAALTEVRSRGEAGRRLDPQAQAVADALVAAEQALDAYDAALEASGRGPVAAYRRLDEAQRWFLAADAAVKPPVIDPEDARELEAAHDEVQAAELRLTAARMPGKNIKKRLDDAVEVEQQVLARMGFATYTAFVMSTTVPLVSPELKAQHEQAHAAYLEAEAAFMEAGAALERDPERLALAGALEEARERARAIVGTLAPPELEPALRERTVEDEEHAARVAAAAAALRRALEDAGVDFGDLDLQHDEIVEVAVVWLADMVDASDRRQELEQALRALEDQIASAELELAEIETSAPSLSDVTTGLAGHVDDRGADGGADRNASLEVPDDRPDQIGELPDQIDQASDEVDDIDDIARADLELALAEVDAEAEELEEQIDAQGALVAAAAAGLAGATAQVEALEAAPVEPTASDHSPDPFADGPLAEASGLAQVEWYLLSRLAAQRSVSYAGSVPLVLDEPFGRMADDDVRYLLERLARMTDAVQVVFIGDDRRVVEWGAAADERIVSVVSG